MDGISDAYIGVVAQKRDSLSPRGPAIPWYRLQRFGLDRFATVLFEWALTAKDVFEDVFPVYPAGAWAITLQPRFAKALQANHSTVGLAKH